MSEIRDEEVPARCRWCKQQPAVERGAGYDWRVECQTETCPVGPSTNGIRGQRNAIKVWNSGFDDVEEAIRNERERVVTRFMAIVKDIKGPNVPRVDLYEAMLAAGREILNGRTEGDRTDGNK